MWMRCKRWEVNQAPATHDIIESALSEQGKLRQYVLLEFGIIFVTVYYRNILLTNIILLDQTRLEVMGIGICLEEQIVG